MTKQQRMKRVRAILIYSGILLACYYFLPLCGMTLEPVKMEAFLNVGLLHLAFPLYLYISAIALGLRHGFCSIYAVAAAVLFLPTLLLFFNPGVWPAALIYGGIALVGNLMGYGLRYLLKKQHRE